MKTIREIQIETLENMRERNIISSTENEVYLSALRRERIKSGNEEKLDLIAQIRARETNTLQFASDLSLIEEKLHGITDEPSKSKKNK